MTVSAIPAGAGDRLLIRVSPSVAFAPANLVVKTTVQRDDSNRSIEIIAESANFYRSSEVQLEGDRAPRVSTFEFRSLPSGTYAVTAVLLDGERHPLAEVSRQVSVIANGSDGSN